MAHAYGIQAVEYAFAHGHIRTARLRMRPLDDSDERLYCRLYMDPEVMRNIADPFTMETAQRSFHSACRQQSVMVRRWIIHEKAGQLDIGLLGLLPDEETAEIGVMFLPGCSGRGFATESMQALVDRIFIAQALPRLIARQAVAANPPVNRLMTKLGFRQLPPDKPWSERNWELRHDEWKARSLPDGVTVAASND